MLKNQDKLMPLNNGKTISVPHSKLEKKLTEDLSSKEMLKLLKLITPFQLILTKWESLNSPFTLKNNSNLDSSQK
jgi:hypothetical protein